MVTELTPSERADWRKAAEVSVRLESSSAGWAATVLSLLDALDAAEAHAKPSPELTAVEVAERAVVEALVAERAARDAIPKFEPKEGDFPPQAFWDGARKAEAAHVDTERALDTLLALRAKAGR